MKNGEREREEKRKKSRTKRETIHKSDMKKLNDRKVQKKAYIIQQKNDYFFEYSTYKLRSSVFLFFKSKIEEEKNCK